MERDNKHVETKESKNAGIAKPVALPRITYNQEELQELVDALQEKVHNPEKSVQLSAYINTINQKILEIQGYQSKQNPALFYQSMNTALLEIKNAANAIYELTRFSDQVLANSLKRKILEWIKPLEGALAKYLEITPEIREDLVLKTKHLCAEQSFVSRQPALQQALMQHLGKLNALLLEPGKPASRCYISYAWPSRENKEQEYWVQPFLYVLYDHLTAIGIRVIMDIRDNKPGDNIYKFMQQYHDGNHVILIGTESLLEKHRAEGVHAVHTELSIIANRFEQDQKQFGQSRIYPLLISGTINSAYPEIYDKYHTVRDARDPGYLGNLKKLTDWFYEQRLESGNQQYADLWRGFFESMPTLSKDIGAVEQELALGYHRQRLDNLRQDIQMYQSDHPNPTKMKQPLQQLPQASFNLDLVAGQKSASATEHTRTVTALRSDINQFNQEGMKRYHAQEYKEALECFQQALSLQQQISSFSNKEVSTLHFRIGFTYFLQYQRAIQQSVVKPAAGSSPEAQLQNTSSNTYKSKSTPLLFKEDNN